MLYVNLLMYTRDEAIHKVKSNGADMAFESFRFIMRRGRNASTAHKMVVRNKEMHPEGASKVEEIPKRISEWKQNFKYLSKVSTETFNHDQMKTIMI